MANLREKLARLACPPVNVPVPQPMPDLAPVGTEQVAHEKISRLSTLRTQMDQLTRKRERAPRPEPRRSFGESDADEALSARVHAFAFASNPLPGECSEGPDGPLRSVFTRYQDEHRHGSIPVASALEAVASEIAVLALDPSLNGIDFKRALYIDTETTGLAGGAGTLPFLIGMAWFEGRALCVEQMLLERPGLEAPMLARLAERIRAARVIVSFNGKSFDWPLLRTRFVLTRVAAPPLPPHLDLLHCARRVYKRRLGSVRLVHLEEQVLGFTRVDDIAGALIPETYLGFLRGHVPGGALAPIVEHNRSDLVALPALLGEITRRFLQAEPEQDARDQLGFAGVAARANNELGSARARIFAASAATRDLRGELAPEAHLLSAELCRRAGDIAGAERALLSSIEAACGGSAAQRAHLALAKLYEHRLKRYDAALGHAREAAQLEGEAASARRIARLEQKGKWIQPAFAELDRQRSQIRD